MVFKEGNEIWKLRKNRVLSIKAREEKSKSMKEFYKYNPNSNCGFQKCHKSFKGCEKTWFTTERMKGNQYRKGIPSWNKGKRKEELKTYYKNGWKIVHYSGEEHWNWQGGKSFEIYPKEFKIIRKEIIKLQQVCQICDCSERLVVHHIDRNKNNNNITNLIVLCRKCHGKVHSRLVCKSCSNLVTQLTNDLCRRCFIGYKPKIIENNSLLKQLVLAKGGIK